MSALAEIIRSEIAAHGAIPFARFMEMALYHPELGYYESDRRRVGFQGDFYTSVSAGELFGQLLAFQFAEWLKPFSAAAPLWLIEAGAHDGKLAADILAWLRANRPELAERIVYAILEPSAKRQEWQREKLAGFSAPVRWFSSLPEISRANPGGVIFSNELLDALPVHRLGWDAVRREWFEWGVAAEGETFIWTRLASPVAADASVQWPEALLAVLPDQYTIETCPAAVRWWGEAAGILRQGILLTLDYGFTEEEMISPSRTRGTLRAYSRHQSPDDVLAHPGEQDLTAHVNFTAVQTAGENAGLQTEGYLTQPQFLTRILMTAIKDPAFVDWNASRTRQFQTLTHPQHLGRAFKALIQRRA